MAHVFGHISPPFAFQKLRLTHMRERAVVHLFPSYIRAIISVWFIDLNAYNTVIAER